MKNSCPPQSLARRRFTFDRGTEFAGFRALEDGIGASSWLCDPQCNEIGEASAMLLLSSSVRSSRTQILS